MEIISNTKIANKVISNFKLVTNNTLALYMVKLMNMECESWAVLFTKSDYFLILFYLLNYLYQYVKINHNPLLQNHLQH